MFLYKGHRLISFIISSIIALLLLYFSLTNNLNYQARNIIEAVSSLLTGANKRADIVVKSLTPNINTPQEIAIENNNLKKRITELQFTINELQYQNKSYQNLLSSLHLPKQNSQVTALPVIGFNQITNILIVDNDNITLHNNQAVYSAYGIVGLIISATDGQARINSFLNPNSLIHVVNQRNHQMYTMAGDYTQLKLQYFYPDADLQVGDTLVTSGLDGVFKAGYTVGVVSKVTYNNEKLITAIAKPLFTFDQIQFVLVENNSDSSSNVNNQTIKRSEK